jgi:hypothetical protein
MAQVNGIVVWTESKRSWQSGCQSSARCSGISWRFWWRPCCMCAAPIWWSGRPGCRQSDRWDMGYQWISRFLANDLVCCDQVVEPFACEILARLAETGKPIPPILDQTKVSDRHQILMLSVRWGALRQAQERSAADLAGRGNRGRHRLRSAKRVARGRRQLAARRSGGGSARRPLLRNPRDDPVVSRSGMGRSPAAQEQPCRPLGHDNNHDRRPRPPELVEGPAVTISKLSPSPASVS